MASLRPRARLWASLLLLAVVLSPGAVSAEPPRGREAPAAPGVVRSDPGLEHLADRARRLVPRVRREVEQRLGWDYSGPAVVVSIVNGHERMCEEARARVPRWAVGVAISSLGRIVMRADLLSAGFGGSLAQVLRHEWVHLMWGARAGSRRRALPLWAEEGLAEEIGGGISIDAGAALDLAVAFDRLLSFADLGTRFPADPKAADLAYRQSRSWVQFVVHRAGWPTFQRVLQDVADSPGGEGQEPFARALQSRTGRSLGTWHLDWRLALEEEATPWLLHLLIRDFQGLLIACLAVVGLVAFVLLIRRRRRQIAALPDLPIPGS